MVEIQKWCWCILGTWRLRTWTNLLLIEWGRFVVYCVEFRLSLGWLLGLLANKLLEVGRRLVFNRLRFYSGRHFKNRLVLLLEPFRMLSLA